MRGFTILAIGAALLLAGVTACGGGGGAKVYEESGLEITFEYPNDFGVAHNLAINKSAGSEPEDRGAVGLDTDNLILVSRYNLSISVTKQNLARIKPEVDRVIGQLAGKAVNGREVEYGGLPGYEYAIELTKPARGVSRMAVLFADNVEYLINCQSTPEKRDKIEDACRKALESLKKV